LTRIVFGGDSRNTGEMREEAHCNAKYSLTPSRGVGRARRLRTRSRPRQPADLRSLTSVVGGGAGPAEPSSPGWSSDERYGVGSPALTFSGGQEDHSTRMFLGCPFRTATHPTFHGRATHDHGATARWPSDDVTHVTSLPGSAHLRSSTVRAEARFQQIADAIFTCAANDTAFQRRPAHAAAGSWVRCVPAGT